MADRFTDKVAVMTGGASGIGAAVARKIASEGGIVILWDLGEGRLAEAREKVGARLAMVIDVSDAAAVAAAAGKIEQELGQIDILVTYAGILDRGDGKLLKRSRFCSADQRRLHQRRMAPIDRGCQFDDIEALARRFEHS